MSVNPTQAPRMPKCQVCTLVAMPEDVTLRLYDEKMEHLPLAAAMDYLHRAGFMGTQRAIKARLLVHRRHVDQFIDRGGAIAPAQIEDGISRIEPPVFTPWTDANQEGINLGMAALGRLSGRLDRMEDADLIAVARMGQGAAVSRGQMELKGAIKREEKRAAIASGYKQPTEA